METLHNRNNRCKIFTGHLIKRYGDEYSSWGSFFELRKQAWKKYWEGNSDIPIPSRIYRDDTLLG